MMWREPDTNVAKYTLTGREERCLSMAAADDEKQRVHLRPKPVMKKFFEMFPGATFGFSVQPDMTQKATFACDGKTYEGSGSSRKHAKTAAAALVLTEHGVDLSAWRAPVRTIDTTPKEMANSVGRLSFDHKPEDSVVYGQLTLRSGAVFQNTYKYHKDRSYAEHKLASILLQMASSSDADALEAYKRIVKTPLLVLGERMPLPPAETDTVEFKGSGQREKPMTQRAVKNKLDDIGAAVCAFANHKGGSVYVGVTNDFFVCGVDVTNHDQLVRDVTQSIQDRLEPPPHGAPWWELILHGVAIFNPEPRHPLPQRPADPDNYTISLEAEHLRLKEHAQRTSIQTDRQLFVLEFRVRAVPDHVFFRGKMYLRNGPQTVSATRDELIRRLRSSAPSDGSASAADTK